MSVAFDKAQEVEAQSWEILRPFIETKCFEGRYVRTAKGRLAKDLQKSAGDVLMNTDDETVWTIEIKAEKDHTGNVFLERWSNRERFTPGWLETLKCDLLLYHFLSNDTLYVFDFDKLRRWLYHGEHGRQPVASRFPQVKQGRYVQLNDTWGYLVKVDVIPRPDVLRAVYHPMAEYG